MNLPDGKGSIQLDGWVRWVKLQIGATPGVPISLIALGFAVAGLCLSLFVRPRRVWIRSAAARQAVVWSRSVAWTVPTLGLALPRTWPSSPPSCPAGLRM